MSLLTEILAAVFFQHPAYQRKREYHSRSEPPDELMSLLRALSVDTRSRVLTELLDRDEAVVDLGEPGEDEAVVDLGEPGEDEAVVDLREPGEDEAVVDLRDPVFVDKVVSTVVDQLVKQEHAQRAAKRSASAN